MAKHLSLENRNLIAQRLNEGGSFKAIAKEPDKNCTSISREVLSESRSDISLSEEEISHLDEIISPLLRKKHSLHHICIHHSDSIMVSESTLYRFVDYNLFSARNIDMPRKVRYANVRRKKISKWIKHAVLAELTRIFSLL